MYPNLVMPTNTSLFPYLLFQNVCTIIPQDVAAAFFLFSPFCPYNIKSPIFHNSVSHMAFHIDTSVVLLTPLEL